MSKRYAGLSTKAARLSGILGLIAVLFCGSSLALTPPRPGEIEGYQDDGTLNERLDRAHALSNDQIDPLLLHSLRRKLATARGEPVPAFAPPINWRGGLPATGNPKTLVILVEFPDCPRTGGTTLCPQAVNSTLDEIAEKFFGEGSPADAPYESLSTYYRRASHDNLHISGDVLGWYRARYERAYYEALDYPAGNEALIMEALDHYADQGHDFAQYDNDNDGRIDAVFLKWTGPDNGWANFWWAYQGGWWNNSDYRIDGKSLGKYVWSWIENLNEGETSYKPNTDIHETGHLLGLPDYYDYDTSVGPQNGVGGFDMMDSVWGDHNAFSKTVLGWVDPIIVSRGTQRLGLRATSEALEAVMVTLQPEQGIFGDLFIAEYRRLGTGNDPSTFSNGTPGTSGLAVWHVNAALDGQGLDFLNNNSQTNHKLLRLMEADGLEEIERSAHSNGANAGDLYVHPSALTPATSPNSHLYDPDSTRFEATVPSGIHITDISAGGGDTMTAVFSIGTPEVISPSSYQRKVRAYFHGGLGRAPTAGELDDWSAVLFDNSGSVWRPSGTGLQRYLSDLVGWGAELPTSAEAGAQVDTVLTNLFGTTSGLDSRIPAYYVDQLLAGSIRARGLVNAILNDLAIMPRVDGTYGKPNGWTGGPGDGLLTPAQISAYRARIE